MKITTTNSGQKCLPFTDAANQPCVVQDHARQHLLLIGTTESCMRLDRNLLSVLLPVLNYWQHNLELPDVLPVREVQQ